MKSANQKERELIIKLHQEGKSTYNIANTLGVSQTKASFWIRRFNKTGNLENKPRSGRPTKLNDKNLEEITKLIKLKLLAPKSKKAGISSKEMLKLIEEKTSKKYSLRHAQRTLHKLGLSLVTPRVNHVRNDKAAQEKFRTEFKKNSDRNMWVIQ